MRIAACCIFRDEARYLKEWVEFHLLVGFDILYMFNNLSVDNYMEVLEPYVSRGQVVLNQILSNDATEKGWIMRIQNDAFSFAVKQAKDDGVEWLALLNSDEFLYPIKEDNIKDVLDKVAPDVGQVSVNWQMFGHNHKTLAPGELLTEHLTLTQGTDDENRHVKPIVRPEVVDCVTCAHFCELCPPYRTVNTHGEERTITGLSWPGYPDPDSGEHYHHGPFDLPVRKDILLINHYTLRDLSFVEQKLQWYRCFGYAPEHIEWARNRANDKETTVIHKYLPQLKERMDV